MKKVIILFVFCFSVVAGFTQNIAESNKVVDAQEYITITGTLWEMVGNEKVALPFANVFVEGTADVTVSDFDGSFTLKTTQQNGQVKFTYKGYEAKVKEIEKTENNIIKIDLLLEKENTTLVGESKDNRI